MPTIRSSLDGDLAAITSIYRHHVLHGTGTFETDPPAESDMATRRADVLAKGLPYLVAVDEQGQVLGFAYANWFKPRPAYRFSAEDSIYVHDAARGQGLGDRKSTRLNSSHLVISYAVFCLKKKKNKNTRTLNSSKKNMHILGTGT